MDASGKRGSLAINIGGCIVFARRHTDDGRTGYRSWYQSRFQASEQPQNTMAEGFEAAPLDGLELIALADSK